MKQEEIRQLFQQFEQVACVSGDVECWSARELCELMGYKLWQNFTKVIDKAKAACSNVGQNIEDHFIDVNKMVNIGSGAERQIDDIMLTQEHIDNNAAVRKILVKRGIIPENLPLAEDVKKVEQRLESEQKKVLGQ